MNFAASSTVPSASLRPELSRSQEPESSDKARAQEESEENSENTPFEAFFSPAKSEAKPAPPAGGGTAVGSQMASNSKEPEGAQAMTLHRHTASMNLSGLPDAEIGTEAHHPGKASIVKPARPQATDATLPSEQTEAKTAVAVSPQDSSSRNRPEITKNSAPPTQPNPELAREIQQPATNREQSKLAANPAEEAPAMRQERLHPGSLPIEKAILQNPQTLKNPSKTSHSALPHEAPSRSGISPAQRPTDTRSRPASKGMDQAMERPKEQSNRSETPSLVAGMSPSIDQRSGASGGPGNPQPGPLSHDTSPLPQAPSQMASSGTAATFDPAAKAGAAPMMQQSIDQIQSLIKDHALILKRFDHDTLTAEIRPDGKTSITLSLTKHADGITVNAQLDSQNAEWLKTHWGTLQSKLAEQNISLETPKERWDSESALSQDRQTGQQGRQARGESTPETGSSQHTHKTTERSPQVLEGEQTEHSTEKVYWA